MARMPALTRAEARHRAELIDVRSYAIDLDLTGGDEVFGSVTAVRFTVRQADTDTFVELRPATLRRAELNGVRLDTGELSGGRLPLTGLGPGEHELRVEADMRYSRVGEGMHRFTDPADGRTYLYTQCCMSEAPRVFACFDQPDLKAAFSVSVTAPPEWTVLGNGVAHPVGERSAGRWECATTPPVSTYLVAVAAGPYHSVRSEHAGIPFGLHVRRSLAPYLDADAEELLDISRRCFDRYHEIFDEPYPFDSYDQAFVPEFNEGAMENPGLVTFRDEFIHRSAVTETERQTRGMVIAHEMAHMWFGDLVTLRWWDDIWLNESFAEYLGYQTLAEVTRFTGTWTDFAVSRKSWGYDADQRPTTHPVAPEPEAVPDTAAARLNFDGISYAKGASALRQLVAWLGEKTFLAGVNDHFARHRFGNATLQDLIDSLARASADRDVPAWAERWLGTTGVDTLRARPRELERQPRGGPQGEPRPARRWQLEIDGTADRPHRIAIGLYDQAPADPGQLVLRDRLERDMPPDGDGPLLTAEGPRPDLVLLNDGDLTYAKVRPDPESRRTLRRSLSGLPGPLPRAVVWNALRDMVRDGELPPVEYVETLSDHLPLETDNAVVNGVLTFARTQIADRYLPTGRRTAVLDQLATVCRTLLTHRTDATPDGGPGPPGTAGSTAAARENTAPAPPRAARRGRVERGEHGGPPAESAGPTSRGGDTGLRLTAARHLIDCQTSPAEPLGWLAAGALPDGPPLDAELRWRLLLRLATLGGVDAEDIEAARAEDPSATGEEGAARCLAALPDRQRKAAAWTAMFEPPDTLSNYLFTATAQGFWQPEQRELLGEFAARYYTDVVPLVTRRGAAIGRAAGRFAFPHPMVDEETLRRGTETLPECVSVPALRRELTDQLDELRRALTVRAVAA